MGLTFVLGGARSGKSSLAVRLAERSGLPVVFVATATDSDEEMSERIARHRAERPPDWIVVEEPCDLEGMIRSAPPDACLLVDCLTLWVSNVMLDGATDDGLIHRARVAAMLAASREAPVIAVSNEVGSGIVPDNALARRFRDVLGATNAAWASAADRALLVVAGRTLELT